MTKADVMIPTPPRAKSAQMARRTLHLRVAERRRLLVLGDLLATLLAVFLALYIWSVVGHRQFDVAFVQSQILWAIALPLLWVALAGANDYYNLQVTARSMSSFQRLAQVSLQLFVIYAAIYFFSSRDELPRLFILYYAGTSVVLISIWRSLRIVFVSSTNTRRRALIVAAGHAADLIYRTLRDEAASEYDVIGCVPSTPDAFVPTSGLAVFGGGVDLPTLVNQHQISELIVASGDQFAEGIFQGVMACYSQGVVVAPIPLLYEQVSGRVPIEYIGEQLWASVLQLEGYRVSFHLYLVVKRAMDILFALIGLICFLPLFPFLALAIKLTSRGPVFYRQERVGRGGETFNILKLRSMRQDAEAHGKAQWAATNDPRITPVGRFLRKSRLDEVPQLFNVLRGDMSLIGPRPERPQFVETLAKDIPYYRSRLVVKPGLTGWAQVRYRYGNTTEDALRKLQYDLYYIRHQSLLLDLLIAAKTVGTIVTMQGT